MIYIVNGFPGCGKTTFERAVCSLVEKSAIRSTIDPIKDVAWELGWDGEKDEKGRRFLSELKRITTEYCDYASVKIIKEVDEILEEYPDCVVFIDCREPENIKKLCAWFNAKSVLVRRASVENKEWNNYSDSHILDYDYDIIIENNGDLHDLSEKAEEFVKKEGLKKIKSPHYINLFGEIVVPFYPREITLNQQLIDIAKKIWS